MFEMLSAFLLLIVVFTFFAMMLSKIWYRQWFCRET